MPGFVDEAQVHVRAGDGGAGAVSFRREAHVSKGGPDGGDGGSGGDVYLEATNQVVSLLAFEDHPHRRAENGTHGSSKRKAGRRGRDLVVPVPEGTLVRTLDGDLLADLVVAGDRALVAAGGRGGRGNARFLTNKLRAPAFAEQGEVGQERWLNLELELMADVAVVGFPNAGKSTLVSRVSAAKPKIADYPFTTLEPHLGVVDVDAFFARPGGSGRTGSSPRRQPGTQIVIADIPGLVEGAAAGRGLGDRFLRHVERARVLLLLADLAPTEGRPPAEQIRILLDELRQYRPELLDRPRLVVGSRADAAVRGTARLADAAAIDADAADAGAGERSCEDYGAEIEISAMTGQGLPELVTRLARLVEAARRAEPAPRRAAVVHRPAPEGVTVRREAAHAWVVEGREALRAVAVSDLTDPDALAHVQRRLRRLGVDRALARAGAREGDDVRVGGMEFSFEPD